jgi:hypothetical protein
VAGAVDAAGEEVTMAGATGDAVTAEVAGGAGWEQAAMDQAAAVAARSAAARRGRPRHDVDLAGGRRTACSCPVPGVRR